MQNVKPLIVSVLFFALSCERIFIETHNVGSRCYRTGKDTIWKDTIWKDTIWKDTICRRVRASFSLKFYRLGQWRVKTTTTTKQQLQRLQNVHYFNRCSVVLYPFSLWQRAFISSCRPAVLFCWSKQEKNILIDSMLFAEYVIIVA